MSFTMADLQIGQSGISTKEKFSRIQHEQPGVLHIHTLVSSC